MNKMVCPPESQILSNFKKHIINKVSLLVIAFFTFTTSTFAQTTDTFTSSNSWTVPAGVTSVTVEIWGAGGGGGGSNNSGSGGSGGGSGAYVTRTVTVTPGAYAFTIGTGGAAGGAAGGTGGTGGNSTITIGGFTLAANGGTGGVGNAGAVGTGGAASGGTTNTTGNPGGIGGASGGNGGSSPNGGTGGAGNINAAGAAGSTPGAGGGGGERGGGNQAGGAGAIGEIRFTYIVPGSYCTPTNTTSTSYYITNVTSTGGVANFNNNSVGFAAYSNFSAQFVSQYPGASFSLTASHPTSTYGYNVWIDWNNDSDFNDAGENVLSTSYLSTPASLGNVTIPLGQATGNYRMRIRNAYLSNPAPACGSFGYGEAEDYTVQVIAPPACTGTPVAGTTTTSPVSGNPGSTYVVSATGFSNATGLTFQWQYSTTGSGGPWTNQGAATGTYSNYTATAPALGITTHWRLVVTCTASSQSANSATASFASVSTQNIPSTGNNSVTCGTNIVLYDNGGASTDYINSSNGYTVLDAGLGATINISGNYTTESVDYIRIYNGTGTSGTLLGTYSGTGTINYTGTVGQTLTIQFTSDSSVVYSGFALSVTYTGVCYPACSGTPTGGTATASPASASPGSSYTVSATGFTGATGLTFQWQYSTDGGATWTNQGAATGTYANYTATAPALGTTVLWHLIVTCTASGQSATSSNGTFNSVSTQNIPTTGNNTVSCGTNIVLYDNGGVSGDYANTSSGYTVLEAGLAATVTISGNYVTENGLDYIRIYNGTGTGGTLLASYTGTGTINYTGTAGQTLTVQFYSDSSAVYSGFNLSVSYTGVCFPACSGTPTAGTVTTTPNTTWPGNPYTVSATGYTQALNLTYQWQYSTTGSGGPWINAGIATSSYADYNATAPASGVVLWHLIVTCTNSSSSATSSNGTFTTMAVSDVLTGCPNVVSGGLGLSGADPAPLTCSTGNCTDLEANYLDLGNTTNYIVEPIAYNPPRAFNGLANPVSVNVDDVWSPVVNLPFNFCFYGNTYNQCVIGSNGILSFNTSLAGTSSGYSFNNNIPISGNSILRENSIFGVFHDINPGVGTLKQVGWELITLPTGCRALVASWSNVPMFSDNAILYTGMMVLYENSNVIEVYIKEKNLDNGGAGTWNNGNAIVGIQNATGTLASVAPGRNGLDPNWTAVNEAWRFVPSGTSIATIKWYEGAGTTGPVVGTTPVINVCPAATTTYTAEITYTLCNGATLKEVDQTLVTVSANKTWNGSSGTNWNTAANWTPSGVPTATEGIVIPNTTNKPIISGGTVAVACNVNIQSGGSLTINAANTITVTNAVTVAAGGSMIIENTGSLVQINNVVNSGNIQYKRTASVRRQDYVYWSSPVASFASSAVSPGTSLGFQYKWTPTIGTNTNGFGNWALANETMTIGKGYCLRAPDSYSLSALTPYTATFIGVPNNGNLSIPISRGIYDGVNYSTGTSTTLGTKDDDNWNLVGNPYPSAIHAINFLTLNPNIAGFVNIWTHGTLPSSAIADPFYSDYAYNYTPTDYITYNSVGASSGAGVFNGRIAGGQGFFVSMLHGGATTQNLTFNNSLRNSTYNNTVFYRDTDDSKDADELEKHRIWFDLVTPSGTNVRSLLGYVENATNESDRLFDAFSNEKASFNIFSLINEEQMLIQGRKLPFDSNDKVNIGVSLPQDGLYKIAISSVDGLFLNPKQNIYVEDKLLNVIFNLKEAPYSFMGTKGNSTDRFVLRYSKTDKITELTNQLNVYDNTVLTVESGKLKIKDIVIFDTLGKLVLSKNNVNNKNYQITNLNRTNSMLIVKVTLEDNTEEVRKIIY